MDRDVELTRLAVAGDDTAIAELVRRTQPAVWRLCRALGSGGDADDLVQETYLRALRALHSYRGEAPFAVWLLAIGRRVCADHVRRQIRQRRLAEQLRGPRHDGAGRHDLAAAHDLDDLLDQLRAERREAFVLTQIVGLSYEEAAGVTTCPVGTIRSRVARARGDLLELLRRAEAM